MLFSFLFFVSGGAPGGPLSNEQTDFFLSSLGLNHIWTIPVPPGSSSVSTEYPMSTVMPPPPPTGKIR